MEGSGGHRRGLLAVQTAKVGFECYQMAKHSVQVQTKCSEISVHSVLSAHQNLCMSGKCRVKCALCVVWVATPDAFTSYFLLESLADRSEQPPAPSSTNAGGAYFDLSS